MPFTILVVCLGNVCRSLWPKRLLWARLEDLLPERAAEISVS